MLNFSNKCVLLTGFSCQVMLSLIVCSRKFDIPDSLKDNINRTIGTEYELVVVDNSKKRYSIFSAYNEGVRKAKGEILCFMHEDIIYKTENWGKNVIRHFEKEDTGLIGVFGGHYLPDLVCHIGDSELLSYHYYYTQKDGSKLFFHSPEHFSGDGEVEVVAVDGLWLAVPKALFQRISFDEGYAGFHYYDMDICMQVWAAGYKCKVVDDVVMEHNSAGVINDDFVRSSYIFFEKWQSCLPMKKGVQYGDETYRIAEKLCQFKRYSRELELENKWLEDNVKANSKLWKIADGFKKTKKKIEKKCINIFRK